MKNFQNLTIQDCIRIARRRIWYLIVPTLLVSVGTAIFVWRMPSIYKSETTILVSERLVPEDYIGSLVRQTVVDRIEFAKQQLRSRTFVERIAQEFQLQAGIADTDQVVNAVINSTEITVLPPNVFKVGFYSGDPNTAQAVTRRLAERVMQSNNTFRQERVNGTDQFLDEQLRQATDDLAQAQQKLREFSQRQFPGVPDTVSPESLVGLQTQLTTVEADLQAELDQRKAYERSIAEHKDLKAAVKPTESPNSGAQTTSVSSAANEVAPPSAAPSLLELTLAQKKADLTAMLARYKPEHPDVVRVAREIRDLQAQIAALPPTKNAGRAPAAVPQAETKPLPEIDLTVDFYEAEVRQELDRLNRDIAKKEVNKKELSSKIATYIRRTNMPPDLMQQLDTLTHDVEAAKQRYNVLSTKKVSSDLAGKVDTDTNNKTFTTIDPPSLPQSPVRPARAVLTGAGCLAGLMLGFGFIVAREMLDQTLSDETAAVTELKLPVLTSIPIVGSTKGEAKKLAKERKNKGSGIQKPLSLVPASDQAQSEPATEFSIQAADSRIREVIFGAGIAYEQYQMMRAELGSQRQTGLKSLIVTSAVPDEGKTFVACCLAAMLAKQPDKKVLLIDGDLRTGSAGHSLGFKSGTPGNGLSNVLAGEADVENCLMRCVELNLWFLPAGRAVENPVELLSSPRLQQTMRDLMHLFDWVIVDSPPVLPIADTNVLSAVCDAAIVVVRADRTPVSLTTETIKKIGRERVFGLVMNYVREIGARNYYGRYYGRYHDRLTKA